MAQTISGFDAMLKDFYEGAVREQLSNEIKLFRHLESSAKKWAGRRVQFPVHLNRNIGVGATAESGALPTAGAQTTVAATITASYNYGRIDLTGQVMAAGKLAFAEALAFELEGIKKDLSDDLGRQSYGEGHGIIAQVGATFTQGSATLFNQWAEPGQPGARYGYVGQGYAVGSPANMSSDSSQVGITAITVRTDSGTTTDTMQFSGNGSGVVSSVLSIGLAGTEGQEMKGLRCLVEDVNLDSAACCYGFSAGFYTNSIQGINRTTYSKFNSTVIHNSLTARVIDSTHMQKAFDNIKKLSGDDPDYIFGEYSTVSAFLDSVSGDRRYATKDFDAGMSKLSYNGVELVQDRLAPYNELYIFSNNCLKQYTYEDFSFADIDGSVLKNVTGYDRWEAFLKYFGNIGVERPNAGCKVMDILPAA